VDNHDEHSEHLYDERMADTEKQRLEDELAAVGIHVTEEGKARARVKLREARERRDPVARAELLARLGRTDKTA